MNESETRAEHIDPALKAAGWGAVEGSSIKREYAITLGDWKATGSAVGLSLRLRADLSKHQACCGRSQSVGRTTD